MKTMGLLSAVVLVYLLPHIYAMVCYECEYSNYGGNCYEVDSGTNIEDIKDIKYCWAEFTIQDGVTTDVERGWSTSGTKPSDDLKTDNYYEGNDPTSRSTYTKYCTGDRCNNYPPQLKTCSSTCKNGSCDYITGECACYEGYQGSSCEKIAPRKCHQCSSEYDATCDSSPGPSTSCDDDQNYCSISRTTVLDTDAKKEQKVVTIRGCTDELQSGCSFTDIHTDDSFNVQPYLEYTCFETCNTDSCNDKASDKVAGDQSGDMYCLQCSNTSDTNCDKQTTRSICPSGTTHCSSTVVYTIAEGVGRHVEDTPHYKLLSVDRGCATKAVPKECKEESFSSTTGVKKVTCTETCTEDGCNTGWPTRPKCVICSATDNCIEDPPFPKSCPFPYQSYCYIQDEGIKKGTTAATSGYPRRVTRGCSHYNLGTSCSSSEPRETEIESCNRTCTTDGCNVGSGGEIPLQILLYVLLVALSANLLQSMN